MNFQNVYWHGIAHSAMAGNKFQAMDCLMFQNQKPLSDSVTRSPFELFWTAKNIEMYLFQKLDHCRPQPSIQLERGHSGWRSDESSLRHAGWWRWECWGFTLRERNLSFGGMLVACELEIDNFCAQAKESDPEHSVKVSGLAYIALVALHRFGGVSQNLPISPQITKLISPQCPKQSPMYPMCSRKMQQKVGPRI